MKLLCNDDPFLDDDLTERTNEEDQIFSPSESLTKFEVRSIKMKSGHILGHHIRREGMS